MVEIEVAGGPAHNRVDANLINESVKTWDEFVSELEAGSREYGVSNNSLKEKVGRLKVAIDALYMNVMLLPAQGRRIEFTAETTVSMSEIIRTARGESG